MTQSTARNILEFNEQLAKANKRLAFANKQVDYLAIFMFVSFIIGFILIASYRLIW